MTFGIITVIILCVNYIILQGGFTMENKNKYGWLIAVISIVAALTAATTAFLVVREKKKKDDAELEEYLDCSIM